MQKGTPPPSSRKKRKAKPTILCEKGKGNSFWEIEGKNLGNYMKPRGGEGLFPRRLCFSAKEFPTRRGREGG